MLILKSLYLSMLKSNVVQYNPSITTIRFNQLIRFIKVGGALHLMAFFGFLLFYVGFQRINILIEYPFNFEFLIWIFITVIGFSWIPFAEFDALGRYQNYKQIKDLLFMYGFDSRLIKSFTSSKCQRNAALIASRDLGIDSEVKNYFYKAGYRWYHILPSDFVKNPYVLLKEGFWRRILFTKHYHFQNFYW